jgi:putative spermidine/putrescine transport system ATP-binding protein
VSFVTLEKLSKRFGEANIFTEIDLAIPRGVMCVLVGPSGCGKTTLLRVVAGLTDPDSGRVLIDGQDMTRAPPQRRGIGMVFQHYALFPNLTVAQNLAFGLQQLQLPRDDIRGRVHAMLDLVGLTERAAARPRVLSGGQRQRVALARALIMEPKLLLFDEPMSALDAQIRKRLREELMRLQRELGFTGLFVTHDQEEALVIGDQIAVMQEGRFLQVGTPLEVYNRPASRAVARFIGDFNVLEPPEISRVFGQESSAAWAIHPEAVRIGMDEGVTTRARILAVRLLGSIVRTELQVAGVQLKCDALNRPDAVQIGVGTEVSISILPQNIRQLKD